MSDDLRAPYFETGMRILGEDGYAGLKQAPVCAALGVSTGAFYHSFESWGDYCRQLLDYWQRERTTNLVALAQDESDPVARLLVLLEVAVALPHRAEAAIRVWSLIAPEVAAVQAEVDAQRFAVIDEAMRQLAGEPEGSLYTHAAMALLIGFEQQRDVDPQTLRWSLGLLLETARDRWERPDATGAPAQPGPRRTLRA